VLPPFSKPLTKGDKACGTGFDNGGRIREVNGMKITGDHLLGQIDGYVKNRTEGSAQSRSCPSAGEGGHGTDRVVLSAEVLEVYELKSRLEAIPDVREERVAALRKQIENGTYKADGKKIAARMIKESLENEILPE